jgi:hypothetical protein
MLSSEEGSRRGSRWKLRIHPTMIYHVHIANHLNLSIFIVRLARIDLSRFISSRTILFEACLVGLQLLRKRLRLLRWSVLFDEIEAFLENVWQNGSTCWTEVDLSIFRVRPDRVGLLLFRAEKILPMTIPLDVSGLNFRAGSNQAPAWAGRPRIL